MRPAVLGVTAGLGACFFAPAKPGNGPSDAPAGDVMRDTGSVSGTCIVPALHDDFAERSERRRGLAATL